MTINFWKGLFENLGTRLNFSSAYHPQMDGQSEIANLTILYLLKSYVTEVDQRSQWEKYLPLVEYACNNTVHASTGKAPFEVIEGRFKSPLLVKVHEKIFAANEYSCDLKESFQKIKEAISISQQKQKVAANKRRRALAFKENDWVLLKFPKARLRYTSAGKNPTGHQKYYAKLAKRYYGPFQILKPINKIAYQLKLPNHWLIHNAFHVSLLKPYKGKPPSEAIMEDPLEVKDQEEVLQPESILIHEDKVLRHEYKRQLIRKDIRRDGIHGADQGEAPSGGGGRELGVVLRINFGIAFLASFVEVEGSRQVLLSCEERPGSIEGGHGEPSAGDAHSRVVGCLTTADDDIDALNPMLPLLPHLPSRHQRLQDT
ncbi:hypothetical protein L7F22_006254 [Adiantum nelumboides]|nr:hypothetical protein [Adiantum nelumboides]